MRDSEKNMLRLRLPRNSQGEGSRRLGVGHTVTPAAGAQETGLSKRYILDTGDFRLCAQYLGPLLMCRKHTKNGGSTPPPINQQESDFLPPIVSSQDTVM